MTWSAFLTLGGPEDVPVEDAPGALHDIVLAGKGKSLRVVESADGAGAIALTGAPMACALDRFQPKPGGVPASSWSGLIYPLKAGTENIVAKIFETSGRPDHEVKDDDGAVVGWLLRTLVFVGTELAIRVIEVDGDLRTVSRHMSRQEPVRAFEQEIEAHLAVPRDMVTPEGAMKFFAEAGMQAVSVKTA